MRVLVTSTPGTGHVHPIAPLARALATAGHDVVWATAPQAHATVEQLGFRTVAAGMNVADRRAGMLERAPHLFSMPVREQRGVAFPVLFGEIAAPVMHADLVGVFDDLAPDLVVHDFAELAAAAIATARGIPHVTVGFSGAISDGLMAAALASVEPVWAAEGQTPTPAAFAGDLLLHPFPLSMDTPRSDGPSAPIRAVAVEASAATEPPNLAGFGADRPGVYVTFGTEIAAPPPWAAIFEAVAELDVDVIATVGPHVDPDSFEHVPGNVRVERFVPQRFVIDRATVVVSHAGAGTLVGAASSGKPQLHVPIAADQWDNADLLSTTGAAVTLEPEQRDVDTIRPAVERLLVDQAVLDAARALAHDFAAMPHPTEVAATLAALT